MVNCLTALLHVCLVSAIAACLRFDPTKDPVVLRHTLLSGINTFPVLNVQKVIQTDFSPRRTWIPAETRPQSYTLAVATSNGVLFNKTFLDVEVNHNATIAVDEYGVVAYLRSLEAKINLPSGAYDLTFQIRNQLPLCNVIPVEQRSVTMSVRVIPAWLVVLPPIVTLCTAMLTKHVLFSLFSGVYMACLLLYDYNPVTGFARFLDTWIPREFATTDRAVVLIFSWMLAGMVAILAKSGGAAGLASEVVKRAKTSSGGQWSCFLMGLFIFFDDYSNLLIVGNTLRPVTDRLRVSHEKLAFLVDCTAAPIASIAPISAWIGFELSMIESEFEKIPELRNQSAYVAFIETIPRRFYPIFLLVFVVSLIAFKRDFGPMLTAERRARESGQLVEENARGFGSVSDALLQPKKGVRLRWYNAVVPVSFIIISAFVGLIIDGCYAIDDGDYSFLNIFSKADSYNVLMWTGMISLGVPLLMYWCQGIMSPKETCLVWVEGMKELMEPVLILILAWVLGATMTELRVSDWLAQAVRNLDVEILPTLVFLLSALTAFCTGSSWSTMSIMFPIVVPLSWRLSGSSMAAGSYERVVDTMASILSGSVLGDHVSPISDTTVLSCLSCRCDVSSHVKTQFPYAITTGVISVLLGTLPCASKHFKYYYGLLLGSVVAICVVRLLGKTVEDFDCGGEETMGFDTETGKLREPVASKSSDVDSAIMTVNELGDIVVPVAAASYVESGTPHK